MSIISGQDWEPVILNNKKKTNNNNSNTDFKKNNKLYNDLENENDTIKPTVSLSNSLLIQNGRKTKNLTQKQLAQKLNIDSKIIQGYEAGKIVPDVKLMVKIENILNIKLNKKKSQ